MPSEQPSSDERPGELDPDYVAIRTEKPGRWRSRNPAVEQDLLPRLKEGEHSKSAWTHVENSEATTIAALVTQFASSERCTASLAIHALALFVFQHHAMNLRRDQVRLISFGMSCIDKSLIERVSDTHLVEPLDSTHIGLLVENDNTRQEAVSCVFEAGFSAVEYTRDELRPLYIALRDRNVIRTQFNEVAAWAFAERE